MKAKSTQRLIHAATAALAGMLAAMPAGADDTEIYLGNNTNNGGVQPNVLLIMDTSGSMATTVDDLDPTTPNLSRMQNMQIALKQLLDKLSNVNVGLMRFTDVGGPILFPIANIDADACTVTGNCASNNNVQVNTRIGVPADDAEENLDGAPFNPAQPNSQTFVRLNDQNLILGDFVSQTGSPACPNANTSNPLGTFVGSTGSSSNIFKQNGSGTGVTCTLWQSTATAYDYGLGSGGTTIPDCRSSSGNCNDTREEILTSGSISNNDSTLNFDPTQINGLRFTDLAIPRGARIVDAHITYKARNSDAGDNIVHYFGQSDTMNTTGTTPSLAGSNTITLDAVGVPPTSSTANFYKNATITITSGTGAGQVRTITAYNGGTRVATVSSNWTTPPPALSTYSINSRVPIVTGTTGDISHRNAVAGTQATVAWDMPDWSSGNTYTTPDLSPIVQEIVCRGVQSTQNSSVAIANPVNLLNPTAGGAGGCFRGALGAAIPGSWSPPTAILGTAASTSGATNTINLSATAPATSGYYNGMTITITAGKCAGQTRTITSYSNTRVATVNSAWTTTPGACTSQKPDNTSVYAITGLNAAATLDTMVESTKTSMTGDKGNDDGALIGTTPVPAGDMVFLTTHDGPTSRRAYTEQGAGSTVANHPVLDVTYEPGPWSVNQNEKIGLRFTNVGIPQGAVIKSASIEFTASKPTAATDPTTNIIIRGELANDSTPFTTASDNVNSRTKTSSSVAWNSTTGLTGGWVTDQAYATPDLTSVVQEIVNQSGWCGNNHMTFFVHRIMGADTYYAYSADKDPSKAPILHVTYDASSLPAGGGCINEIVQRQISQSSDDAEENVSTHAVSTTGNSLSFQSTSIEGMRFEKINIPRNTTILHAFLQYTSTTNNSGSLNVTYRGELISDSPAFTTTTSNISSRTLTAASVTQAGVPNWTANETVTPTDTNTQSADLKNIVQEIVNQPGWNPFQSLSIIATGSTTNKRQAMSNDVSPGQAPILVIQVQWGGSVLPPVVTTVRDVLKQQVDGFTAAGYTPIVSTLYEASQYYRGLNVVWGKQRSEQSANKAQTRVSHPASYTGGTLERPAGCTDSTLSSTACATGIAPDGIAGEHIAGSPVYISPITSSLSCATNHIVFLTDGIANHNDTENGVDHGLSLVQSQVGTTCRLTTDQSKGDTTTGNTIPQGEQCGRELVNWLHNNDLSTTIGGTQRLDNFFGVGFNLCGDTPAWVNGNLVCCVAGTVSPSGTGTKQSQATSCTLAPDPGSVRFLKDMVKASGGSVTGSDSHYVDAFTADQLVSFFTTTFATILSQQSSFVAPAIAANAFNRLFSRNEVYFGLFQPQLQVKWNGNVKKYNICDDPSTGCNLGDVLDLNGNVAVGSDGLFTTSSRNLWTGNNPYVEINGQTTTNGGAGGDLTDFTQRTIYIDITSTGATPASGTSLDAVGSRITSSASDYNVAAAQPIRNAICANPALNDTTCNNLILWMLGQDIKDENNDGSTTDTRWSFGDVLHSSPIVVTYGKDSGGNFIDKVLVGTNDGGLHMLNGSTGAEDWEFMPQAVLGNQQALFNDAQAPHIYGLDDTPTVRTVDVNGDGIIDPSQGDKVIAYIGMRRGGNHIYALDITPSSTLANVSDKVIPKFLWRIDGGSASFPRLGETWSKPQAVDILTTSNPPKTPVLIFAGGYDAALENGFGNLQPDPNTGQTMPNPNNGNAIYIVNADTGNLIFSIGGPGSNATIVVPQMTYAIPSDIAAVDTDGDGAVDRLYVGDAGGQVWRVDLHPDVNPSSSTNPAGGSVVGLLASISDPANLSKQRRFFYPPSVVQVKDNIYSNATNGEYDYVIIASGNRGHPLDTNVLDRVYAFRDKTIGLMTDSNGDHVADNYPATGGTPISEANMVDATNRVFSPTDADLATIQGSSGWFFAFPDTGEKGLSAPVTIADTVFLTSYLPEFSSNTCSANAGAGKAYNFNILTTAATYNWDITNTTGTLGLGDRSQVLGSGIPSEVVPIFTGSGVTLLIGTGGGAQNIGKILSLPRYRTYWYQEE